MKIVAVVLLSCVLWEAKGYPYYPYYGNMDSISYGASDSSRGGMALSRYYSPYYNPRAVGGGMAAFMFRQPEEPQPQTQQFQPQQFQPQEVQPQQFQPQEVKPQQFQPQEATPNQYYVPDRRQPERGFNTPQENEVYYPQAPEIKPFSTEQTEIAYSTEKEGFSTTLRTIVPELIEPEVEAVEPVQPKKRVSKKKQVKKPAEEEDDDEQPKMPAGAFFPMFFGWGRSAEGGASPGGATAIANAYSTGRGGVATSHATAYGPPRPDTKYYQ